MRKKWQVPWSLPHPVACIYYEMHHTLQYQRTPRWTIKKYNNPLVGRVGTKHTPARFKNLKIQKSSGLNIIPSWLHGLVNQDANRMGSTEAVL